MVIPIPLFIAITLTLILHSVGSYLLLKTFNWNNVRTQQVLILNLSICEWLVNFLWLLFEVLYIFGYKEETPYYANFYCVHLACIGTLYLLMVVMTLDRLMAVIYPLKYIAHWSIERTKKILIWIWTIGATSGICFVCLCEFMDRRWYLETKFLHLSTAFNMIFIAVAFVSYVLIFLRYKKSKDSLQANGMVHGGRLHSSASQHFHKSRFHIPILIVLTYIIFNILPHLFYILELFDEQIVLRITDVLFALGYLSDGLIYIFLQQKVRRQLMVCCHCTGNTNENSNATVNRIAVGHA